MEPGERLSTPRRAAAARALYSRRQGAPPAQSACSEPPSPLVQGRRGHSGPLESQRFCFWLCSHPL